MKVWAKIINNRVKYPPKNDYSKGVFNVDKNQQWLNANGYSKLDVQEISQYLQRPSQQPKRYSTLKIIRVLGDKWEDYKVMLFQANVLDQFFAANYLSQNDPIFVAFMQSVPQQVKDKLTLCEWENN